MATLDSALLLRIAPLISSTGSLVHAYMDNVSCGAFVDDSMRKESDAGALRKWFNYIGHRVPFSVLALNFTSLTTAFLNLRSTDLPSALSYRLYLSGLVFAIGHLVFIPWVMRPINDLMGEKTERRATDVMRTWLGYHRLRMSLADFPAWLSFVGAVVLR